MTNFKFLSLTYVTLFRKSLSNLMLIDIILYSVIENINIPYLAFLPRTTIVLIGIILIKKSISDYNLTLYLENVFFIAGAEIKKLVLFNFYLNNFIYTICSVVLCVLKLTTITIVLKGFYVLNLLMCITFLLKFVFFNKQTKMPLFLKSTLKAILYYIVFSFFVFGISFPYISTPTIIIIFFILINYYNRTFNYYDINQQFI